VAADFLDTSAVVKRYLLESGSAWVQALTDPVVGHSHFLVRIALAEIVSAVTRREKGGSITLANAATALADFRHDFDRQYLIVEVSTTLVDRAARMARKHALRGYDAVQLAAALEVQSFEPSLVFVSADRDLNAGAMAEGLPLENPNDHP
jgi:predicted nucleic acid-binding protein